MSQITQQLQAFKFVELFNQLGWDRLTIGLEKEAGGHGFSLRPVAQKRGIQILHCLPGNDGAIPSYATRQKIERKVTADVREHLIIFTDAAQTRQVWQWVSRAPGRPAQYREVKWQAGQSTELLRQKLETIAFTLNEEESLTFFAVAERLRSFDRDAVTKKFYKAFQAQRDAFQAFIDGIPPEDHQRWYTAVVIDRLMFLWFLQEKGFLNNEKRYLRNRLEAHLAVNRGVSFYKGFLSPLFFRGFAEERTETNRAAIEREFGKVPYLNGGLFAEHELEREYGEAINIPDAAFSSLFAFFDEWDWHLDERPLASGKEINPDVLGYIFEKFVNQKQMGAYYTKEDITEYIAKNTIIPCLFEKVRAGHAAAFDAHAWPLLREDPRRYMYPAMLHGLEEPYPADIAAGLDTQAPDLLQRRKPWNKTAAPSHGLPTEIWRETIARHHRTREILAKLRAGEIGAVADLITCNLNIRQFAQDVIERCADPALLRAFWVALAGRLPRRSNEKFRHGMSVLDPTCGSGAFLFAALQILKPLYQACLTAMSGLLVDEAIAGRPLGEKWKDVEEIVERFHAAALDRERDYAITKHIIVHNLYGVDIEAQATEIAKLRLFLKLVAFLEPGDSIEPLPDIDFNIRVGNTLVGYASKEETERAVSGKVGGQIATQGNLLDDAWEDIRLRLTAVEETYNNFQILQVSAGGHVTAEDKQALGGQLHELEETLNYHLCREYGKDPNNGKQYAAWKASHRPFHWYVDFYPIMAAGGFDVVIGNPPFVENKLVKHDYWLLNGHYSSEDSGNLYTLCMERAAVSLCNGIFSMIVPYGLSGLNDAKSIRAALLAAYKQCWFSGYAIRPSKLFDGVDQRLCIFIGLKNAASSQPLTAGYRHWSSDERPILFSTLTYNNTVLNSRINRIPQFSSFAAASICAILESFGTRPLKLHYSPRNGAVIHYHRSPRYWIRAMDFEPHFKSSTRSRSVHHFRDVIFSDASLATAACVVINSSLFFFWFITTGNGRNITGADVAYFPIVPLPDRIALERLNKRLMDDYKANSIIRVRENCEFQEFRPSLSKSVIDEIDQYLARHYGFTDEQLDYIINYDIKYRMGQGANTDD